MFESAADIESIVSESEIENETPSDTTEEVSTLSLSESNEDSTELPKNEATSSIINNTPIEESSQPTEYEIYHATAMAEKERASQKKLDKVLTYIKQTLVLYLNETDLNRLCGYVTEYYLSDSLPKVEPIKVDSQLKTIDIMHFGWNIGKAFGKPRLQTATFIKRVFAHTLSDSEISTIERNAHESVCKIKLIENSIKSPYNDNINSQSELDFSIIDKYAFIPCSLFFRDPCRAASIVFYLFITQRRSRLFWNTPVIIGFLV